MFGGDVWVQEENWVVSVTSGQCHHAAATCLEFIHVNYGASHLPVLKSECIVVGYVLSSYSLSGSLISVTRLRRP